MRRSLEYRSNTTSNLLWRVLGEKSTAAARTGTKCSRIHFRDSGRQRLTRGFISNLGLEEIQMIRWIFSQPRRIRNIFANSKNINKY